MQIITFIFASSDVMVIHYCIWLEQKESVVTDFPGEIHHHRHGYVDVIEVPMPDRAVKIGIFVLGRDWCHHKLWRPFSVEFTKWTKYKIDYVPVIVINGVAWEQNLFLLPVLVVEMDRYDLWTKNMCYVMVI